MVRGGFHPQSDKEAEAIQVPRALRGLLDQAFFIDRETEA